MFAIANVNGFWNGEKFGDVKDCLRFPEEDTAGLAGGYGDWNRVVALPSGIPLTELTRSGLAPVTAAESAVSKEAITVGCDKGGHSLCEQWVVIYMDAGSTVNGVCEYVTYDGCNAGVRVGNNTIIEWPVELVRNAE